jgi:xanthine dehydrogenase accessory factor
MNDIIMTAKRILDSGESLVLATILEKSGSAPRSEGAKMIIKADFTIAGSIGGGLVEALIIKSAARVFHEKAGCVVNFLLTAKNVVDVGTSGEGNLKVMLEYVDCHDAAVRHFYDQTVMSMEKKTDFVIITEIPAAGRKHAGLKKWLCTETGLFGSECDEITGLIQRIRTNFQDMKYREAFIAEGCYFIEPSFTNENVVIFGAGHIGKVLADLCKVLGFYVVIVDDREEFANSRRFETADEVIVTDYFDRVTDRVKIDQNSFVIIVTRGHLFDKEVLAQMLLTEAFYIGMIGSRNKRNEVYQSLLDDGFAYKDLERVHSPIGLPINGETPEELAVSIAAEMIKIRRAPKR